MAGLGHLPTILMAPERFQGPFRGNNILPGERPPPARRSADTRSDTAAGIGSCGDPGTPTEGVGMDAAGWRRGGSGPPRSERRGVVSGDGGKGRIA